MTGKEVFNGVKNQNFVGANLRGLELVLEDIDQVNLSKSDLSGSNLRGVLFRGVNLKGVIGADFTGAIMD